MKRLLLAALLLAATPAWAQMGLGVFPAPRYFAPADVLAPALCWGLKACGSAQLTGSVNAVRIRRASDNAELDIVILTNGELDVATAATHCAATTCFVRTLYAQIGTTACTGATACNVIQATAGNQPAFIFNCNGTRPCIQSSAATTNLVSATTYTPTSAVNSFGLMMNRESGTTCHYVRENASNNRVQGGNSAGQIVLNTTAGGSITLSGATDAVWHSVVAVLNGAGSVLSADAISATGTATGNTTAGAPAINVGGVTTVCDVAFAVVWNATALTGAQRNTVLTVQKGMW